MSTSRSLNKVILIGNLTRNPILKTTSTNSQVCTFGLATNSVWKDSQNNVQERTEFHNIITWNKLAEICAQLLAVGMYVYIEGELRTRTWTDDNGIRHYRTEVKAQDMKILDKKGKDGFGIENASAEGEERAAAYSREQESTREEQEDTEDQETESEDEQKQDEDQDKQEDKTSKSEKKEKKQTKKSSKKSEPDTVSDEDADDLF
jgi:single-strand DNA-binding protein